MQDSTFFENRGVIKFYTSEYKAMSQNRKALRYSIVPAYLNVNIVFRPEYGIVVTYSKTTIPYPPAPMSLSDDGILFLKKSLF